MSFRTFCFPYWGSIQVNFLWFRGVPPFKSWIFIIFDTLCSPHGSSIKIIFSDFALFPTRNQRLSLSLIARTELHICIIQEIMKRNHSLWSAAADFSQKINASPQKAVDLFIKRIGLARGAIEWLLKNTISLCSKTIYSRQKVLDTKQNRWSSIQKRYTYRNYGVPWNSSVSAFPLAALTSAWASSVTATPSKVECSPDDGMGPLLFHWFSWRNLLFIKRHHSFSK